MFSPAQEGDNQGGSERTEDFYPKIIMETFEWDWSLPPPRGRKYVWTTESTFGRYKSHESAVGSAFEVSAVNRTKPTNPTFTMKTILFALLLVAVVAVASAQYLYGGYGGYGRYYGGYPAYGRYYGGYAAPVYGGYYGGYGYGRGLIYG